MFLVFSICVLFAVYGALIFIEDRIPTNHKNIIYWATCFLLIILAGTREIGIDPDSEEYEAAFLSQNNDSIEGLVEFTFTYIAIALNTLTDDAHSLFLVYAFMGVVLKFIAFRRYSDSWLLIVMAYLCYYYELHETCQIRAGVLSGFMLLAIPFIADNKRLIAFLLIVLGSCFHLSGLILIPLLFFGNKPLGLKWKTVLALSIPVSYAFAGFNLGLEFASEIPYIGDKIALYQNIEERGIINVSSLNLYGPQQLFTILIFYFLLYFADLLTENSRYFPLMLKIMATALVAYAVFSFIPTMGERMGSMYRTIMVVLLPTIACTLLPKRYGYTLFILIAFIFLNYSLRNMYGVVFFLPPVE